MKQPTKSDVSTASDTFATLTSKTWKLIFHIVERQVTLFKERLTADGIDVNLAYFDEWKQLYSDVNELSDDTPNVSFKAACDMLFGAPKTIDELAKEVVKQIPPLISLFKIQRTTKRGEINVTVCTITQDLYNKINEIPVSLQK